MAARRALPELDRSCIPGGSHDLAKALGPERGPAKPHQPARATLLLHTAAYLNYAIQPAGGSKCLDRGIGASDLSISPL